MGKLLTTLNRVLGLLEKYYARPKPPKVTAPLEMILLENVGYLVDDEQRAAAFAALKKQVGSDPEKIVAASEEELVEIARLGGIMPELRARPLCDRCPLKGEGRYFQRLRVRQTASSLSG